MNTIGSSPVDAPPAYSVAHEFDQKMAIAIDESLQTSSGKRRQEDEEEDTNERHEDTRARNALTGLGPVVQPLNFRKKHNRLHSDMPPTKERPSWLEEAQQPSTSTSNPRRRSLPQPNGQRVRNDSPRRHILPEEDNEDRSVPPPPFVAVDNSLDGPAYERYPSDSRRRRAAHGQVVMRYAGEDMSASPLSSPLASPTRPRALSPSPAAPPRMRFDPSVAYDNTRSLYGSEYGYGDEPASVAGGAAALYRCVSSCISRR